MELPGDRFIDEEVDPVTISDQDPAEWADEDSGVAIGADPELDALVVEFVECFNAGDSEAIADLLAPGAESGFLAAGSPAALVEGLADLAERHPGILLTRAELGPEPVAAVWVPDPETEDYDLLGVFRFERTDTPEAAILGLELTEPDGDLIAERPDRADLSEWDDWRLTGEV